MKIALAQINPTVGDFAGNAKKILEYAARAEALGVGLVVFPELAVCGYPPADFLEKASFVARAEQVVAELAGWTAVAGRPAILCGTVMATKASVGKQVRNVAALMDGGRVSFVQQKMLLPFYDVFDEQRYFEPATEQTLVCVGGEPLAITICEDAWNDKGFWPRQMYPVDPVEKLMGRWESQSKELVGQQRVILNISASPYWQGKPQVRQNMLAALARRHHAFVAMTNQVGGNDSLVFDGSSLVIRPDGHVVARAASFAEDLVVFDTRDGEAIAAAIQVDEVAAMWSALVLGTRDYVRKCGFSKVLVGLSGGIDSALVAAIAVEALGKENVIGVGMPTEYSSLGSIQDARKLAKNLGVRFELLPIHDVFAQVQHVLQPLFAGTPFGLAEENLQPRIRGTLLMALSNKFGALVLTTGNKSEMSTGYCTLYGDMVGALAVIGDVMKMKVYALSRYVNRVKEVIPWETISKPPSAELRPEQRDTDSLPPYEVLDPILEAYVERYCSAEQIAEEQGLDVALVRSVLQLVEKSEYKRQQAAPVLKVTRKSFGMGRRFPIAVKVQV
ncbi:NAD+ synthase [Tunturibacter empetritectus]|uniref:Glutamine-dependent NAD(+) synthetase n=1 Tax=Tunturiibacter empetritectus TaxID=3069691 RepID=A0A7W8IFK6_9BACT|nr:NAD+ synthase [Edaphobacter lichenicola]MBB5316309.1 NAD+ synthase (glutamine-hydrolyzing) [Edaphobacter lichenicola]